MRIDSSGRLLVGTSSSSSNTRAVFEGNSAGSTGAGVVQIARGSTYTASNTNVGNLEFTDSNGNIAARINCTSDGTTGGVNGYPGRLTFQTESAGSDDGPSERMRIDRNGLIRSVGASHGLEVVTARPAGTTYFLFRGHQGGTVGTPGSGTASFQVLSNGNTQNTNNSYTGISDVKLKENIVDASSQWDDIKSLQVRNYNFKAETNYETYTQIGVVAQEVEATSPGLVIETPDLDADGNDLGTTTKSVNYSVLYMKAVKALQEAMDRIETLEAKVAALEAG